MQTPQPTQAKKSSIALGGARPLGKLVRRNGSKSYVTMAQDPNVYIYALDGRTGMLERAETIANIEILKCRIQKTALLQGISRLPDSRAFEASLVVN